MHPAQIETTLVWNFVLSLEGFMIILKKIGQHSIQNIEQPFSSGTQNMTPIASCLLTDSETS